MFRMRKILAGLLTLVLSAAVNAADAKRTTIAALAHETAMTLPVEVEGTVEDVFLDDVDPRWRIILLQDGPNAIHVSVPEAFFRNGRQSAPVGSRVRLSGLFRSISTGSRELGERNIVIPDDARIVVLAPPARDLLDCPPLPEVTRPSPDAIAGWGRRSAVGCVVVSWNGNRLLLRTDKRTYVGVELADGEVLPPCGAEVKVAGTAETDLFRVILTRARVRVLTAGDGSPDEDVPALSPDSLYFTQAGRSAFDTLAFGHKVRAEGRVTSLTSSGAIEQTLTLDCGGRTLLVDVGNCPDILGRIAPGCRLSVTGICIHEVEKWRPTNPYPRITRLLLVARGPDDITVLSLIPWWTPRHSFLTIAALLLIVVGILIWNVLLRRLAERRGKELAAETLARAETEFKVYERTRLAVELHDSVAQNLTGALVELRVAKNAAADPACADRSLDLAMKTLNATNEELRNCIWDLRNHALEDVDLNEAIRKTLAPHVGDAELTVRFSVPRARISDNTAHHILRIVRELTVNALRHGQATQVKVAGAIEGDNLLFSVRDNGTGFDPRSVPGMEEGHFGLEGIRERVKEFAGTFSLDSRPGAGTKATVSLRLPHLEQT